MSKHPATDSPRPRARSASTPPLILILAAAFGLAVTLTSCSSPLATAPTLASSHGSGATARDARRAGRSSSSFENIDQQVVMLLQPGTDAAQVARDLGLILLDVQQGVALMQRPPGDPIDVQVHAKNEAGVLSAEDNTLAQPAEVLQKSWAFDDGYGSYHACMSQPAIQQLGLASAHAVGQGDGVLVAILDTGIDPSHPLFAGRIAGGWDYVDDDSDPTDIADGIDQDGDGVADEAYGHGTHIAGVVAMTAPHARLLIVRVLDAEGRGDVETVAAGIRWAVAQGAQVINMSFGMLRSSYAVTAAIREAAARGVVCVSAAGNEGAASPQQFPAADNQTLAVAASDAGDVPAAFTSFGTFVDLCAPGVNIRSAYPGNRWVLWSGTSMSAPFVSGTAALLIGLHPGWDLSQVMARLRLGARPLVDVSAEQAGKLGAGVLDIDQSLADDRLGGAFADKRYGVSDTPAAP
jgi:subtilisin family serine protease